MINDKQFWTTKSPDLIRHEKRINYELRELGVSQFWMASMQSRYLPHIIKLREHIKGVVYGYRGDSFAMLVATDTRIIFLENKPIFLTEDDITYDHIRGIDYSPIGLESTLTLRTDKGAYKIKIFNESAAQKFIRYISKRLLVKHER